ncbi:MAG: hypothetical protein ACOC2K_03345 [Bacteroidota bacterium]
MRVIKLKKVEGCLEGSNVHDILLDDKIDREFIDHLGKMGKLIYMDSFDKPFFKVIVRGRYTIKGSQTNKSIRIIFPEGADPDAPLREISEHIGSYPEAA